jgi:hypothetical protein
VSETIRTVSDVRPDVPSSPLELRHASTEIPFIVVVPERRLLVIDGVGHPEATEFRMATTILRAVHDSVRASLRRRRLADPSKTIIEIVWLTDARRSLDEMILAFSAPESLHWRQMIELPPAETDAQADEAIEATRQLGGRAIPLVRRIAFSEGRAAQVLHLGGLMTLAPTVARLCGFVTGAGLHPRGDLHQLVYGDPQATSRDRARSILRIPIA